VKQQQAVAQAEKETVDKIAARAFARVCFDYHLEAKTNRCKSCFIFDIHFFSRFSSILYRLHYIAGALPGLFSRLFVHCHVDTKCKFFFLLF
jgi:hypothetical protein